MAKRTKSQAKKTKRQSIPRSTRKFQLRKDHAVDQHVAEILDFARSQRKEVTMIRDGVRLLWALQNDDKSVLYEMFPHMKPKADGGGGNSDLHEIKSMLEIVVAGRKTGELVMSSALPTPQKPTAPPKAEIKPLAAVSADTIADNFLSMFQ